MYPQDLEIDGTRDSEGESVKVRDRVSAWVYTESISERAEPHLHSLQTESGGTHRTKPTIATAMPQGSCCCSRPERGDARPPLLMSKHDFIKQKQSDRETNERQREGVWGEFCFRYAEDMSSFGSLPSGCLDAGSQLCNRWCP